MRVALLSLIFASSTQLIVGFPTPDAGLSEKAERILAKDLTGAPEQLAKKDIAAQGLETFASQHNKRGIGASQAELLMLLVRESELELLIQEVEGNLNTLYSYPQTPQVEQYIAELQQELQLFQIEYYDVGLEIAAVKEVINENIVPHFNT